MFCRFCGAQLDGSEVFCHNCGNCITANRIDLKNHNSFTLGEEIKKNKFLYIMSLLPLVYPFVLNFLFATFEIYGLLAPQIPWVVLGLYMGAFAYATTKRSVKFTFIFMIPRLLGISEMVRLLNLLLVDYSETVRYWLDLRTFRGKSYLEHRLIVYLVFLLVPFAIIFGLLKVAKALMNNIRSQWPLGIASSVITIIVYSLLTAVQVSWSSRSGTDFSWNWTLQPTLYYAGGILVGNLLMHIVYKAR